MPNFKPSGRLFRPPSLMDYNYDIVARQELIPRAGSYSYGIIGDANVENVTADYYDPYYIVSLSDDVSANISTIGTAGVLTDNRVDRLTDGVFSILAKTPWLSKRLDLRMDRLNYSTHSALNNYVTGSLAKHWVDDSLSTMATTAGTKRIFSSLNHSAGSYVRDPNCWASVDLTSLSIWNSRGGQTRAGTAITPLHACVATHYALSASDTLRFVTADSVTVTRTVTATAGVTQGGNVSDITIVKLDSPLPASITPARLLPANELDYFPTWQQWPIPILAVNAAKEVFIRQFFHPGGGLLTGRFVHQLCPRWPSLTGPIISGDSGSPSFITVNNQTVLYGTWSSENNSQRHSFWKDGINAALTSLGGGYTVQTVDLSGFTSYGP